MDSEGWCIHELLRCETELNKLPSSIERDARVNLLRYLQVSTVKNYERVYTGLYFDLRRDEGFHELYMVKEKKQPESGLVQPMETGSIEDYRRHAESAKICLDELVQLVASPGTPGREVIGASIKSLESTRRKANAWGGIRYVTDLARATVVCDTPRHLADVFKLLIRQVCRVKVALLDIDAYTRCIL